MYKLKSIKLKSDYLQNRTVYFYQTYVRTIHIRTVSENHMLTEIKMDASAGK